MGAANRDHEQFDFKRKRLAQARKRGIAIGQPGRSREMLPTGH